MNRATAWQLRTRWLTFDLEPLVMGIVNVTPDSFSDGGCFFEPKRAVDHALQLASEGADILDVGGESTRPYSSPVESDEELRRVIPVVRDLCRQTSVPVSVDTSKAEIARQAIDYGAEIVNDVTALESDTNMAKVVVESGVGLCAMHMQGTPQSMQNAPQYDDVVEEVADYLLVRRNAFELLGITRDTHLPGSRNWIRQNAPTQSHATGELPTVPRARVSNPDRPIEEGIHCQAVR